MGKADEALADVRRWLCDNLSAKDAGKVCGMLSDVSWHVNELEKENAKLCELKYLKEAHDEMRKAEWDAIRERERLKIENERLKWKLEVLKAHGVEIVDAVAGGFEVYSEDYRRADALKGENARYRELVEILRRDWHIEASWDGLRKFWYVGLTEEGVRERDARDRMFLAAMSENCSDCAVGMGEYADSLCDPLKIEIGELRELVRDLVALPAVPAFDCFGCKYEPHTDCAGGCTLVRRAEELGIEVE